MHLDYNLYSDLLQKVIRRDIMNSFNDDILPVQYHDIVVATPGSVKQSSKRV